MRPWQPTHTAASDNLTPKEMPVWKHVFVLAVVILELIREHARCGKNSWVYGYCAQHDCEDRTDNCDNVDSYKVQRVGYRNRRIYPFETPAYLNQWLNNIIPMPHRANTDIAGIHMIQLGVPTWFANSAVYEGLNVMRIPLYGPTCMCDP